MRDQQAHGITCSACRRDGVRDNSTMESFFSTLKAKRVYRRDFATCDQARASRRPIAAM
jgi:putative transposase